MLLIILAGGRGFEPLLAESESAVLPLDEPPKAVLGNAILAGNHIEKKRG